MEREPDVEIAAEFKADELRFECVPEVQVGAYADSPAEAVSASTRENLPDRVEPGVVYRNVTISWRLAAWLKAQEVDDSVT